MEEQGEGRDQRERLTKLERKGRKAVEKAAKRLERLAVEYVPVDSLKPNAYNPNRQSEHDFELLLRSMEEDGFTQPVVVLPDGTIVDGEHRWRAATKLGMAEIPVVRVDMTPEQVRISTLRHNRARGSEDYELTAQLMADLRELGALDWAQDSLMMDDLELQRMLEDVPAPEALGADEYSEAWQPGEASEAMEAANASSSMTAEALERVRASEKAVQEARTEEERVKARRDADIFRISLVFTGEEAAVVKAALGDRPAESVLALCRAALDAVGDEVDQELGGLVDGIGQEGAA